jgi:hypothetical protein
VPIPARSPPERQQQKPLLCNMEEIRALVKMEDLVQTWAWSVNKAKEALLALSSQLRKLKHTTEKDYEFMSETECDAKDHAASCSHMVSDLLTLYAHTETFFVPHRYSTPNRVRTHDVAVVDVPGTSRIDLIGVPSVSSQEGYGYIRTTENGVSSSSSSFIQQGFDIHAEILNWNVQSKEDYIQTATKTISNSIKIGDLGVAYLPSISSCFRSFSTHEYTLQSRRTMVEHLTESPFSCWNENSELKRLFNSAPEEDGSVWMKGSEEEEEEVYGSPMFDDLLTTIDSTVSSPIIDIGPSTQRVLDSLQMAISKKKTSAKDDAAVEKVMAGLTVVKQQEPENWIQCEHDTCMKWRKIPMNVDASTLPEPWYCNMNQWDSNKCSCDAPEETYDDDQDYQYVKEEMQTLSVGEKIDLFCTQKGGWSQAVVKETRQTGQNCPMEVLCHYLVSSIDMCNGIVLMNYYFTN